MITLSSIKYHNDHRGVFFEVPNEDALVFKQTSISISKKNTLRGLHYQWNKPMGKKITLLRGAIIECVLDINKRSINFGKTFIFEVSKDKNPSFYIPAGYAHGFLALEDETTLLYQQTSFYNKDFDECINPLDKELAIPWQINKKTIIISERDSCAPSFSEYKNRNILWRNQ